MIVTLANKGWKVCFFWGPFLISGFAFWQHDTLLRSCESWVIKNPRISNVKILGCFFISGTRQYACNHRPKCSNMTGVFDFSEVACHFCRMKHGVFESLGLKGGEKEAQVKLLWDYWRVSKLYKSTWWFQIFCIFNPNPGEMIQFDSYFSKGLKPPTSNLYKSILSQFCLGRAITAIQLSYVSFFLLCGKSNMFLTSCNKTKLKLEHQDFPLTGEPYHEEHWTDNC